jgi:TatD DNase family protein
MVRATKFPVLYSEHVELCDTHCHLTIEPLARDVDGVLERARAAGVTRLVVPAYDLASWRAIPALGRRPGLHPALGLHPWMASEPLDLGSLRTELRESRAVAVGEIGLDFAIPDFDRERQLEVLRMQLGLALELDLPVILHCRAAFEELIATLEPHAGRLRGVVHAFSKGPELAGRLLALGFHIAFGGALTRPRARAQKSLLAVPADRLLLETDAPSIGLEGIPPEQVEPRHLATIAERCAELRGMPLPELARLTTDNARRLFQLT